MDLSRVTKAGIGAFALVLAFGVSGCGDEAGEEVFASVVEPAEVSVVAPQYAADLGERGQGVLVRRGAEERRFANGHRGIWLNDGRVVVARDVSASCPGRQDDPPSCGPDSGRVLDLDRGTERPVPGLPARARLAVPLDGASPTATRVHLLVSEPTSDAPVETVYSFTAGLRDPVKMQEPDFPADRQYYVKGFGRRISSIGAWDYRSFSVGDEESTAHEGYLMREAGGPWEKVLVDEGIRDLWVSRDGAALLGVQRVDPEQDCDGCDRPEQIVEIDPRSGKVAATYETPEDYAKTWRVAEIDKTGDRVLVRFLKNQENLGVWEYDGTWSKVDGTDGAVVYWQGPDDRLEVVPSDSAQIDAPPYALDRVRGGERTRLPGYIPSDFLDEANYRYLPGSLVPLS